MTPSTLRTRFAAIAAVGALAAGVAACGSSSTSSATTAPTTAATSGGTSSAPAAMTESVKIVNFMFQPMSVTVKVGGTVTWKQVDSTGHSVKSSTGAWTTSAVLKPGQTFSHTFTKAGTYAYICGVHNYMMGTVKVAG